MIPGSVGNLHVRSVCWRQRWEVQLLAGKDGVQILVPNKLAAECMYHGH